MNRVTFFVGAVAAVLVSIPRRQVWRFWPWNSRVYGGGALLLLAMIPLLFSAEFVVAATPAIPGPKASRLEFVMEKSRLLIRIDGSTVATYVFKDSRIRRPYFANIRTLQGMQVTRNHPPVAGKDRTDHADMHPGLWLAFGSIDGKDFWRNRKNAHVEHVRFEGEPRATSKGGTFVVVNRYIADGKPLCEETCQFTLRLHAGGYLLAVDSMFRPSTTDITFGDQQEMGFGVRMATPLAVSSGGRMVDSKGRVDEKGIWGHHADWCDSGGVVEGNKTGVVMFAHPKNFRPSRMHARDYGALVVNPFGRKDFGKGAESKVIIKKGKSLQLRFGAFVYAVPSAKTVDIGKVHEEYLRLNRR